ncbi:MAG: ATP-binding protein [Caldilineaceae bacterium]
MTINPSQLMQLIQQNEGRQIEFKLESEKQFDLAEVLMAFANAEGGSLLVGVTDDGEIVGVENTKAVTDRLYTAGRRLEPSLHGVMQVELVQVDDKTVIVATVPEALTATYGLAGGFKIREGSFNRQMTATDVVSHAVQRGQLDYEQTAVTEASLDELNEQRVKDFLVKRLRTSMPDQPLQQLLQTLHAVTTDAQAIPRPTVAGLLFFGDWPQFHLNHATILAARLVGPRGVQIIDRATIEGPMPEMIDRALQFVQRNTRHGLQIGNPQTGMAREMDEYPSAAVREAIINACCHRDYHERVPIQLKIYDDRLVIGNPGGLLPGLHVTELEGKHKTRNPLLADWLQAVGYVERFGIGILRMREAMEQAGLPAPMFSSRPDWFEVALRGPGVNPTVSRPGNVASAALPRPQFDIHEARANLRWYNQIWSFR